MATHRIARLQVCFLAIAYAATALGAATTGAAEPEFTSIFNGRDFDGWRFVGKGSESGKPANWEVRDGVIALTGGGAPHLSSTKEYADFEMTFQWRAVRDKYNSGFYIRSGKNLG